MSDDRDYWLSSIAVGVQRLTTALDAAVARAERAEAALEDARRWVLTNDPTIAEMEKLVEYLKTSYWHDPDVPCAHCEAKHALARLAAERGTEVQE